MPSRTCLATGARSRTPNSTQRLNHLKAHEASRRRSGTAPATRHDAAAGSSASAASMICGSIVGFIAASAPVATRTRSLVAAEVAAGRCPTARPAARRATRAPSACRSTSPATGECRRAPRRPGSPRRSSRRRSRPGWRRRSCTLGCAESSRSPISITHRLLSSMISSVSRSDHAAQHRVAVDQAAHEAVDRPRLLAVGREHHDRRHLAGGELRRGDPWNAAS